MKCLNLCLFWLRVLQLTNWPEGTYANSRMKGHASTWHSCDLRKQVFCPSDQVLQALLAWQIALPLLPTTHLSQVYFATEGD